MMIFVIRKEWSTNWSAEFRNALARRKNSLKKRSKRLFPNNIAPHSRLTFHLAGTEKGVNSSRLSPTEPILGFGLQSEHSAGASDHPFAIELGSNIV